jgi:hypothetical protein
MQYIVYSEYAFAKVYLTEKVMNLSLRIEDLKRNEFMRGFLPEQ